MAFNYLCVHCPFIPMEQLLTAHWQHFCKLSVTLFKIFFPFCDNLWKLYFILQWNFYSGLLWWIPFSLVKLFLIGLAWPGNRDHIVLEGNGFYWFFSLCNQSLWSVLGARNCASPCEDWDFLESPPGEPPEAIWLRAGAWVLADWLWLYPTTPIPWPSVHLGNSMATDTPRPRKPDRVAAGDFTESCN